MQCGFRERRNGLSTSFHIKPLQNFNGISKIDIHFKIFKNKNDIDSILHQKQNRTINGVNCFFPSNEIIFSHLIEHGSSKGNFEVGIQYLLDCYAMRETCQINKQTLLESCQKYKITKELYITDTLLSDIFMADSLFNQKVGNDEIKAAKKIIFSQFYYDKALAIFYEKNSLKSLKVDYEKSGNAIQRTVEFIKRVKDIFSAHGVIILQALFNKDIKQIINAKKIVNKYFNNNDA